MLQKRGGLTGMNATLWLLHVFSNSLPKGQTSYNFHHLSALSNSKGGFRGGPKEAFFSLKLICIIFIEFSEK